MSALIARSVPMAIEGVVEIEKNKEILKDIKDVMGELKGFRSSKLNTVKSGLKLEKKEKKIINQLHSLIELIKDKLSNDDVVLVVCQLIEDYIYIRNKDDMNVVKLRIAKLLLQPVLDCNDDCLHMIISLVCRKLKKTTFYRRNKHSIMRILTRVFLK